ncbi:phage protease [Streptomyces sp. NPDC058469]|uniref:phage protease n=1 Tax=Streptomyces sp. NPDC058469 TaxID=3346514 RepID=UPI003651710F
MKVSQPIELKASAQGGQAAELPTEIQVVRPGVWKTPNHGDFTIADSDLVQAAENFQKFFKAKGRQAPIDYDHNDVTKGAAGWIKDVYVKAGEGLWASVEWTDIAAQQLKNRVFRYLSPEYYFKGWENPEVKGEFHDNVLSGFAVTNHPLFKDLHPLVANEQGGKGQMFIYVKGDDRMKLEDVRKKALADLTKEEKDFLAKNKAELTDAERKTFELGETEAEAKAAKEAADKVAAEKEAADKAVAGKAAADAAAEAAKVEGSVKISASELSALKAAAARGIEAADKLEKNEATALVKGHVGRGAIKSDEAEEAVSILLASAPALRTRLEIFLGKLPDNELLKGSELGNGGEGSANAEAAAAEMSKLAEERAAKEKISFGQAMKLVASEKSELAKLATVVTKSEDN